ncbi:hypothetical protein PAAG_11757 [Paracoccidioides lutzii Pb01]|uniref:Protein kinase domain-containing protein n=1 Tax=Paracoccidioides lutzii (strain ATCC MYA-826 / Pb01) TaxID=502779 RepID=A0A0A2V5V3_PARBA|nr:hypothetical protein PAAG_11757 [Paracoccidioides lutzii Pb01]KGQ01520.1 hypothetical protein PAAG_11757 [Paracoccidioides lutzii Pb01]
MALNIYIRNSNIQTGGRILQRLADFRFFHPGSRKFLTMLDAFEINGQTGEHPCLVHEPLISYQPFASPSYFCWPSYAGKCAPSTTKRGYLQTKNIVVVRQTPRYLTNGISYKLLQIPKRMLAENPTPWKAVGDRTVYKISNVQSKAGGSPILADFGTARIAEGEQEGLFQPFIYCAPDAIWAWSEQRKWIFGILEFYGESPDGKHSNAHFPAAVIALLGPPPVGHVLNQWNCDTRAWRGMVITPEILLKCRRITLKGNIENRKFFMQFIRKMLTWASEAGLSARELLVTNG